MSNNVEMVFDGHELLIPRAMGQPRHDQLVGTTAENLGEVAGRICYDSLGAGRNTEEYHKHILAVQNYNVYEHFHWTTRFYKLDPPDMLENLMSLINRRGVFVRFVDKNTFDVTINARVLLDWKKHSRGIPDARGLLGALNVWAHAAMPLLFEPWRKTVASDLVTFDDLTDDQAHISLYLLGSRGFSIEQNRHRYSLSQRSTRYVNESESEYLLHPTLSKYLDDHFGCNISILEAITASEAADKISYRTVCSALESEFIKNGLDKTNARKQARGVGREYLAHALPTDMIFTAPISGWKWMLSQRCVAAADAQIRCIYNEILDVLKMGYYGSRFDGYNLVDSPDGIGKVLVLS